MITIPLSNATIGRIDSGIARSGIYAIHHIPERAIYIGSSSDVVNRWRRHLLELRKGEHHNKQLQALWHHSLPQDFCLVLLEQLDFWAFPSIAASHEAVWYARYKVRQGLRLLNSIAPPSRTAGQAQKYRRDPHQRAMPTPNIHGAQ